MWICSELDIDMIAGVPGVELYQRRTWKRCWQAYKNIGRSSTASSTPGQENIWEIIPGDMEGMGPIRRTPEALKRKRQKLFPAIRMKDFWGMFVMW